MRAPKPLPLEPSAAVAKTPVPVVNVKAWLLPDTAPPRVRLRLLTAPPEVLIVVAASKVIGVPASPIDVVPLLVIVPAKLTELGAVAVKPAEKVNTSVERFPKFRVPVLLNVVAYEIELVAPINDRLYGPDPELNAVIVVASEKDTAPVWALFTVTLLKPALVPTGLLKLITPPTAFKLSA
ncbi:hypothetical protein POBR111598_09925 [Polynucleobacter brandtiae]